MKKNQEKEHSLRFLVLRAAVVILIVVAALVCLRVLGITTEELDVPLSAIEGFGEGEIAAALCVVQRIGAL